MSGKDSADYQAFLLRVWREDDHSGWRASLENPYTGQSVGFSSMKQLYEFLEEKTSGVLKNNHLQTDL
ncbi:MAG: hypothetical protein WAM60_26285 [Candidatus Promineifilaceae bacterium]